jgi:DNA-binding transcriptional LysR family regulator
MTPGLELREMADQVDPRVQRPGRPLVETQSVGLACRLVAAGAGIALLIPENVAEFVADGRVAWRALADAEAHSHTCLYQRSGQTTAVAMGMFLQLLDAEIAAVQQRFERALAPAAA